MQLEMDFQHNYASKDTLSNYDTQLNMVKRKQVKKSEEADQFLSDLKDDVQKKIEAAQKRFIFSTGLIQGTDILSGKS